MSGQDEYDEFLKSEEGKQVMFHITSAAALIKSHRISEEAKHNINNIEFRQMFVKCLLHMLVGCDENQRPKATE
jgi:hypothetical protein